MSRIHSCCLASAVLALWPTSVLAWQWATPPAATPLAQQHSFQSAVVGQAVTYQVMLPAGYDQQPGRRFPVLYWLHGANSVTTGITPLSQWFSAAIAQGKLPPAIVVFPNGMPFGMWIDSKDGSVPMETVVIEELLPEVDGRFRTIPNRHGRILEGFSMGGYGAARLGFQHHDLFGGVSLLGAGPLQLDFLDAPLGSSVSREMRLEIYAAVWGADPDYFLAQSPWVRAQQNAPALIALGQRIRQTVGQLDFTAPDNLVFDAHLSQLGLPHAFFYPAGIAHEPLLLLQHLSSADPDFYREQFEPLGPGGGSVVNVPGCTPAGAQLLVSAGDPAIGTGLELKVLGPPAANALSQLYMAPGNVDPGNCGLALVGVGELLLGPAPVLLAQAPLVLGASSYNLAIPSDPAWIGIEFALQGVTLAPLGTSLAVGLSNALNLRLGQ